MWGIHKKYKSLSWWENFMGGHINIGKNITIFGANAMCWTVQIRTKKYGYICFTLPVPAQKRYNKNRGTSWYRWYIYFSPNGTPWASTYYFGYDKLERIRAKIRKLNFGHAFDTHKFQYELRLLNNKYHGFYLNQWEVEEYKAKHITEEPYKHSNDL